MRICWIGLHGLKNPRTQEWRFGQGIPYNSLTNTKSPCGRPISGGIGFGIKKKTGGRSPLDSGVLVLSKYGYLEKHVDILAVVLKIDNPAKDLAVNLVKCV